MSSDQEISSVKREFAQKQLVRLKRVSGGCVTAYRILFVIFAIFVIIYLVTKRNIGISFYSFLVFGILAYYMNKMKILRHKCDIALSEINNGEDVSEYLVLDSCSKETKEALNEIARTPKQAVLTTILFGVLTATVAGVGVGFPLWVILANDVGSDRGTYIVMIVIFGTVSLPLALLFISSLFDISVAFGMNREQKKAQSGN